MTLYSWSSLALSVFPLPINISICNSCIGARHPVIFVSLCECFASLFSCYCLSLLSFEFTFQLFRFCTFAAVSVSFRSTFCIDPMYDTASQSEWWIKFRNWLHFYCICSFSCRCLPAFILTDEWKEITSTWHLTWKEILFARLTFYTKDKTSWSISC